jgi:hypothetical protein
MENESKSNARSVFRWLAGISCPFFLVAAVLTAFPNMMGGNNKPSFGLAALLLWGSALFGSIATRGKFTQ